MTHHTTNTCTNITTNYTVPTTLQASNKAHKERREAANKTKRRGPTVAASAKAMTPSEVRPGQNVSAGGFRATILEITNRAIGAVMEKSRKRS